MKAIENWVKDIVFYMIFVTMVMNLLPDPKYEKYLRLFAGAAYRPRLLVSARVHLVLCSCSSGCVRSCCPAALRHAVHWPPASCRFFVCRRTPRRRGLSFSAQLFTRPGKVFIINDRQYRIILNVAAAGSVLKPSGGNYAVLPIVYFVV